MKKAKNEALLALKLAHRKSREEEIALFGHPINYRKVFTDKTKYNRARDKANRHKGGSPYFFSYTPVFVFSRPPVCPKRKNWLLLFR